MFNVTLVAGCSPTVRAGPPTDRAQLLTDEIGTLLTALPVVSPAALAIVPGKLVWAVHIDALVLNDAGNAHDAVWIGTVAALRDVVLPAVRADETGLLVADPRRASPLPLASLPLPLSFAYLAERACAIADPAEREEAVLAGEHASFIVDGADPAAAVLLHSTSTSLPLPALLPGLLAQPGVQKHLAGLRSILHL